MPLNSILTFTEHSKEPASVIRFHCEESDDSLSLEPGTVCVSWLIAPINPQDLMVIAGLYPVKPIYFHNGQAISGYDGVARVEAVGEIPDEALKASATTALKRGDLVIPTRHGLGTWRSVAVLKTNDLLRLPSTTIDPVAASMLRMVFLPAYLMIEDMASSMKPGDWVVHNASSGAIARLVTQFAKLRGFHVCGVVRDRLTSDSTQQLVAELQDGSIGADLIITESELRTHGTGAHPLLEAAARNGIIRLALDAVYGEAGERLATLLSKGGTYVDYGSLGGAEGIIRLSQRLIFWNEIRFRNFRLSEQLSQRTAAEQDRLLGWFGELLVLGRLKAPRVETIRVPREKEDVTEFENAVHHALRPSDGIGKSEVMEQLGVREDRHVKIL
ncbi:hypothetical protein V8C37DRAFT_412426 [Trichoderma ceciliae]